MKKPRRRYVKKRATPHTPSLHGLSSLNIAKMLSHFMTFRSTIKELSSSLQRMEKMLDSTYQMFEIAQQVMSKKPAQKLPNTPTRKSKNAFDQDDIPLINLPPDNESAPNAPFAQLFNQFDPQLIFQALKSPMIQRMLSQFLTRPQNASAKIRKNRGNA